MDVRELNLWSWIPEECDVSVPFLPKPPKQPLSLQATEPDWNDTWELLAECGADPHLFLPGEGGAIQLSPLFGALMDLGEVRGWTTIQIAALNKFLYALLSSLDFAPVSE